MKVRSFFWTLYNSDEFSDILLGIVLSLAVIGTVLVIWQ
jgi:hypothetical protein